MPLDANKWTASKLISFHELLATIKTAYPSLQSLKFSQENHGLRHHENERENGNNHNNNTSKTYHIPGFAGTFGFMFSMT